MTIEEIQKTRLEKVGEVFDLLNVVDKIAKGELRAFNGQDKYLKMAIDTRLKMMEYDFSKAETKLSGDLNVVLNYKLKDGNHEGVSQAPVGDLK